MKTYYENELSKLYNGDCIQVMQDLYSEGIRVDKIITSPPYNTQRPSAIDRGYDLYKDDKTNDEYIAWVLNIFDIYDKILNKNGCIMWNMNYGMENTELMNLTIADIIRKTNFTIADILVWKKKTASPNNTSTNKMTRICEFVYVFCRRDEFGTFTSNKQKLTIREDNNQDYYENVFNFFVASNNDESTDFNKATFSTEFVNELINRYVRNTDIVMDNFSGTGTTMYACECRNIKGYYIELSEQQCEHSANRILKGVQQSIFAFI